MGPTRIAGITRMLKKTKVRSRKGKTPKLIYKQLIAKVKLEKKKWFSLRVLPLIFNVNNAKLQNLLALTLLSHGSESSTT